MPRDITAMVESLNQDQISRAERTLDGVEEDEFQQNIEDNRSCVEDAREVLDTIEAAVEAYEEGEISMVEFQALGGFLSMELQSVIFE